MEEVYSREDFDRVRDFVKTKVQKVFTNTKTNEQRKLEKLKTERVAQLHREAEWVENTTTTEIPEFLERTLMLGPNFNVQNHQNAPYIKLISNVERGIFRVTYDPEEGTNRKEEADEIRSEISNAIINHINYNNQPRHHKDEWMIKDINRSRKFLKEHPDLVIIRADKGTKTVILTATEYHQKMQDLVGDPQVYTCLPSDPTNSINTKICRIVDSWYANKYIDERTQKSLKAPHSNPPRIYGLPKIHKENRPLRPVVSTIGSTTYYLAKFLADILGKVVGKTEHHVVNSFQFAEEVSGVQPSEGAILFSLDVASLYTNVPVDFALECVNSRWEEIATHTKIDKDSFVIAIELVLKSTFFIYQGKVYAQNFGVPMGSPLSPAVSDVVMERLEQDCMRSLGENHVFLDYYRRYVDDCFCVAKEEQIPKILEVFNSFHPKLKFTIEREVDGKLKFLDLLLTRTGDHITKSWQPKQSNGRYLDFTSESPAQHKKNTAIALADRAIKLSDVELRPDALQVARTILEVNNYPEWFIHKVFEQRVHKHYNTLEERQDDSSKLFVSAPYVPCLSEKLNKILGKHNITLAHRPDSKVKTRIFSKLKDPIPPDKQTCVVYSVPCGADSKVYVGQTKRKVGVRMCEHKRDVRNNDPKSGLAQHSLQFGHLFDFNNFKILERIDDQACRKVAEMFHIKLLGEEHTVNLQRECGAFSSVYNGLLLKLRELTNTRERQGLTTTNNLTIQNMSQS